MSHQSLIRSVIVAVAVALAATLLAPVVSASAQPPAGSHQAIAKKLHKTITDA